LKYICKIQASQNCIQESKTWKLCEELFLVNVLTGSW